MTNQTFSYHPIEDANGVWLHPASSNDDEVRCSLIHPTLWKCNYGFIDAYTAVTYVWRDATKVRTIQLEGISLDNSHLHSALRDIRAFSCGIRPWANAFCVNYYDGEEKDRQVGLIVRIDSHAHHIIYLGVDEDVLLMADDGAKSANPFRPPSSKSLAVLLGSRFSMS